MRFKPGSPPRGQASLDAGPSAHLYSCFHKIDAFSKYAKLKKYDF